MTGRAGQPFRKRLRVNVHTAAADYQNLPAVRTAMAYLGLDGVRNNDPAGAGKLPELRTLTVANTGPAALRAVAGHSEAVGGPNEPNGKGPGWQSATVAAAKAVYAAVGGRVPVYSMPISHGPKTWQDDARAVAGGYPADVADDHLYPGGQDPATFLVRQQQAVGLLRSLWPGLPLSYSETGAHDLMSWTGGHRPTAPEDYGRWVMPWICQFWRLGVDEVSIYQLFDQPALAGNTNEDHFGLFTVDAAGVPQPKPAADAIHAWMAAYGDLTDLASLELVDEVVALKAENARLQALVDAAKQAGTLVDQVAKLLPS